MVGTALVHYGLVTGGWQDLRALGPWTPDRDAFLAWLATANVETVHARAFRLE